VPWGAVSLIGALFRARRPCGVRAQVTGDAELADVGMHTISALRAAAVVRHWPPHLAPPDVRIARFPATFSTRNFVLIGSPASEEAAA
jgi:hypothetical protein